MRNKCLFSIALVVLLSLASIVAFAASFSGEKTTTSEVKEARQTATAEPTQAAIIERSENAKTASPQVKQSEYQSKIASMDWSADDSYLLAKLAMAEAESEDTEGKALVILVVLNRVWDDEFPNSIEDVIYQDGQFSPIANGRFDRVEPDADCYKALEMVQVEKWDESEGATYFESKSDSTWHSEHLEFLFQHGDHYFYKE